MKLIRFTASWCQPCKALAKNLEAANLDIPIEVVDIDMHDAMAIEFGIRSVPTLVLFEEKEIARLVGVHSSEKIKQWVKQ
jgi:thioredoxin 1